MYGVHRRGLRLDLDGLAGLDPLRRTVDDVAINEDVAVEDGLTRLEDGPGEAGTKHEGVETHLEELDERLTGTTGGLAGLLEYAGHLLLAQPVLGAEALLLAKPDGEVGFLAADVAAVLAGRVGTLLVVLDGLGGERESERTAQAHLAARTGDRTQRSSFDKWRATGAQPIQQGRGKSSQLAARARTRIAAILPSRHVPGGHGCAGAGSLRPFRTHVPVGS